MTILRDFDDHETTEEAIFTNSRAFLEEHGFKPILFEAVIYALFLGDTCQYIGSTVRIYMRLSEHLKANKFQFNKVLTKVVHKDTMLEEERYLIGLLEPPFNLNGTSKERYRPSKDEMRKAGQSLLADLKFKEAK